MAALWGKIRYNRQQGAWGLYGKWQGKRVSFSAYRDGLGKLRTCQTADEARTLQFIISNEINQGTFNPKRYQKAKPLHVAKYSESWLKSLKVSYATLKSYKAAVHYIKNGFGLVFLPDLNYRHIKDWVNNMVILPNRHVPKERWGQPVAMKTRKNYHGVLAEMLLDAKRAGEISQMPELVKFKDSLRVPRTIPEWMTPDQQEAVLEHIPMADRYVFRFLFLTGVRVSEARALRKSDLFLNREPGYILIRKTFAPVKGGEALKEVKQKREHRIPITADLAGLFNGMPVYLSSEFVFVNSRTGHPYSKNINRDFWNVACKKALGRIVPLNHAGRHSFANQQLARGEDIYRLSRRMGHSSVKVTELNYIE